MEDLRRAIDAATTRIGSVVFVAIDGRGASGKSTLAGLLSRELGAEVVRTDDFSQNGALFDWQAGFMSGIVEPIARGESTLSYQPASWWGCGPEPQRNQSVTDVMIVEGVGTLAPNLRSYWGLGLFVETPAPECFRRGVARDLATGKSKREIERIWRDWQASEAAYIKASRPQCVADVLLRGTAPFERQLCL
ncbi:MAG: uridine kinase family protein [Kiloniellales bacterium]